MENKFKEEIIKEIAKLTDTDRKKDDDSKKEETWGTVEEIWGTAIKISNLEHDGTVVNINAGDMLKLDFVISSETSIPTDYLQDLKTEISQRTDYTIGDIDIHLKSR